MTDELRSKIADHTAALEKIYKQRRQWLYASSIVYTVIIFVIFGWDYIGSLHSDKVWWVLISIGLLISVNWWYWTMASLSTLVRSIYSEYQILNEVTEDIEAVKVILKCKSKPGDTNCDKCPVSGKCKNHY